MNIPFKHLFIGAVLEFENGTWVVDDIDQNKANSKRFRITQQPTGESYWLSDTSLINCDLVPFILSLTDGMLHVDQMIEVLHSRNDELCGEVLGTRMFIGPLLHTTARPTYLGEDVQEFELSNDDIAFLATCHGCITTECGLEVEWFHPQLKLSYGDMMEKYDVCTRNKVEYDDDGDEGDMFEDQDDDM